ncbi:MAG TPA: AraC family transcriptional regulator [Clostridiaceae bacterium]|nr:AraC family transcriptional regulator [Clostridiaceae bacterium]
MNKLTLLRQLSPNIRVALNHRVKKKVVLNKRIIFDYELLYLEKGNLLVEIEDKKYKLSPGDILLFRPNKEHGFVTMGEGETWMPHIHFDVLYYDDFEDVRINFKTLDKCSATEKSWIRPDVLGNGYLDIPDIIKIKNHKNVLKLLKNIIYYFERKNPYSIIAQKSLVLEILYEIIQGLNAGENDNIMKHYKDLDQAVSYITEHYHENIRVEELAKICCLSVHHFERLFKRRYWINPSKYITMYRIEKAKEMMLYSKMSISEIAEQVGYSNIHSFSKAFKKLEGMCPSEYLTLYY